MAADVTAQDAPARIVDAAVKAFGAITIMYDSLPVEKRRLSRPGLQWITAAWHMVGAIQWQSRQSERTIFPLSCCCSVNNAGFTWDGVLHKITPEQWDVMLSVHCTAPFRLVQAASPYMRDAAKKVRWSGVGAVGKA